MSSLRIANAPCSWGVLEFELDGAAATAQRVLHEMASAGYAGTELGDRGFLPTEAGALRETLKAANLEAVASFVPVALTDPNAHAAGLKHAVTVARLLAEVTDSALIVLADDNGADPVRTKHAGRIRSEHGLSSEQWLCFAHGAEEIARAVRSETGGRVAFHPHCAGFVETPAEVDMLMRLTDPDLVGLCLDTGHSHFGGGDPVQTLASFADRIWHMHFKDVDRKIAASASQQGWDYFEAVAQGVFCELGQGVVDFPGVVKQLGRIGYQGWIVVEQDVLPGRGTPLESARRNRSYFSSLGL